MASIVPIDHNGDNGDNDGNDDNVICILVRFKIKFFTFDYIRSLKCLLVPVCCWSFVELS